MIFSLSTSQQKTQSRQTEATSGNFQFRPVMRGMARIVTACCLLALPFTASAASLASKMTPQIPYYYEYFDPSQRPWKPGGNMNIEEVFKNYQFYEIVLDEDGKEITVTEFIKGQKTSSEKYLVLPDGSLRKK